MSPAAGADGPSGPPEEHLARIATRRMDSILESAASAKDIVAHGRSEWDRNTLLQLASEAVMIRIGEAVKAVPRDHLPDVPTISWRRLAMTRDFYAHNQHKINPEALWGELVHEIPRVERAVRQWRARQEREPELSRRHAERTHSSRPHGRDR